MKHDAVIRSGAPAPCDSEQIQFLGQIQPCGFVLEVSPDWNVRRASSNLQDYLSLSALDALGLPLSEVIGRRALHDVRGELQVIGLEGGARRLFEVAIGDTPGARLFDMSIMRMNEAILIEFEPSVANDSDVSARMQSFLTQLRGVSDIERLCDRMVAHLRSLCGFDRVMAYRFHDDHSGEVLGERRAPGMDSFMGLRFPASDIPAQARALYLRNPLRFIADVDAANVGLVPPRDVHGDPLDLSLVGLRAVSSIHIAYLRNMGVKASMSVSLVVDGKLWGLLACHHASARHLSLRTRTALEFYGQMASSIIESMVRGREARARLRAREIHMRMLSLVSINADGEDNMFSLLSELRGNLQASGMATFMDGRVRCDGSTPAAPAMAALLRFLNGTAVSEVYATNCLAKMCPEAVAGGSAVAGVLAVPISRSPRDYVLFFRDELVGEVTWAGRPEKLLSADGSHYSPRQSFAQWKELVRGQSAHWSDSDRDKGESLRITLLEVMLRLTDSAEKMRKQSNDQQDTLIAELNHRVRNILNLIVGLVRQCGDSASSIASFTEEVNSRIYALARAHDQLTSSGWKPRSLSNMVRVEAGAYLGSKAGRVAIEGTDWAIEPDAFATLALVFHELITNSAKYGAFKDSHGHARLQMERRPDGDLALHWSEHGGSVVRMPTRRGFGSTIIERAIPHELAGLAEVDYQPDGLVAQFIIPARYIAECDHDAAYLPELENAVLAPVVSGGVTGNVLLVEDNLLIAMETESNLLGMGASSVTVVSTVGAALDALRAFTPDMAVLDYNLGRETSIPIAERLSAMAIPFLFATGYGDTAVVDARFRDHPVLSKPYDAATLKRYLAQMPPRGARGAADVS